MAGRGCHRHLLRAPDRRRWPRRGRTRGARPIDAIERVAVRLAIVLTAIAFFPGALDPFAPAKAFVLRAVGLPLLALAMAGGLPFRAAPWRVRLADLAMLALIPIALASWWTGLSPRVGIAGEIDQREGVLTLLALVGVWCGARRSHRTPEHVEATLLVIALAGAAVAAYGFAQAFGFDPWGWGGAPYGTRGFLRVFASAGSPVLLGALMAAATVVAMTVARPARTAWWTVPALAAIGVTTVATLSRGAWLAVGVAVVAGVVAAWRDPRIDRGAILVRLVAMAAPALLYATAVVGPEVVSRATEAVRPDTESTPARIEMWRGAIALWRAQPWLGVGPDAFGLAFPAVQTPALWRNGWGGLPVHAHSAPLQWLATLGAIGCAALATVVASSAVALRRSTLPSRGAIAAAVLGIVAAGLFNPLGIAGATWLTALGALAVAGAPWPAARRVTPAVVVAVLFAAMALGAVASAARREMAALRHAGEASAAMHVLAAGGVPAAGANWSAVEAGALRAAELLPYEDQLARLACDASLARARTERPVDAAADLRVADAQARRAVALVPRRASNVQRLANVRAAQALFAAGQRDSAAIGLVHEADSLFAAASALAPSDGLILVDRARSELLLGRVDAALVTGQRLVTLYPEAAAGHAVIASARMLAGELPAAREALVRALSARWDEGPERERAEAALRALDAAGAPLR